MKIHREGYQIILSFFLSLTLLNVIIFAFVHILIIPWIVLALSCTFLSLIIWFFRVPNRTLPNLGEATLISPADGKTVVIEKIFEDEYFQDERIQVSIFMSPLNVHQNIYPISGIVVYKKYHPGKYLVAWHPKSSKENERTTVVIRTASGEEIMVRQIAGAVARRIKNYGVLDDQVSRGEEMGFIKFGSRVDIILPTTAKINTQLGDIVSAKISLLASLAKD